MASLEAPGGIQFAGNRFSYGTGFRILVSALERAENLPALFLHCTEPESPLCSRLELSETDAWGIYALIENRIIALFL